MNRYFLWILVGSMLIEMLVFSSISLAEEGKWRKRADMPTPRWSLSSSVVNGKIYAIGGAPALWIPVFPTMEEYDPLTNKWTKKSDMLTGRRALSTSVVNGKIYTIGGAQPAFPPKPPEVGVSTIEEYDPATDKWTKKADMPTARWGLSTSAVNGKIYAIGGAPFNPLFEAPGLSIIEEYDPLTDKWTKKADMPTARWGLSTSAVNGKIYAIGGSPGVSAVEEYDPLTDKWTRKADMPTARWGLSTSVVNGEIYAIGGVPIRGGPGLSTVEEYDTGLAGEGIEAKKKFVTSWGKIKSEY